MHPYVGLVMLFAFSGITTLLALSWYPETIWFAYAGLAVFAFGLGILLAIKIKAARK